MPNNISVFKTAKMCLGLKLVTGSYSAYLEQSKAQLHTQLSGFYTRHRISGKGRSCP